MFGLGIVLSAIGAMLNSMCRLLLMMGLCLCFALFVVFQSVR